MPNLGPFELIIILVIIIIIFGVGRLPEVGGAIGKGIREFRKATQEGEEAKKELEDMAKEKKEDAEA
ncbi:MAG: hypothetical protein Kow0047_13620 [Anaerolineae bacterium]